MLEKLRVRGRIGAGQREVARAPNQLTNMLARRVVDAEEHVPVLLHRDVHEDTARSCEAIGESPLAEAAAEVDAERRAVGVTTDGIGAEGEGAQPCAAVGRTLDDGEPPGGDEGAPWGIPAVLAGRGLPRVHALQRCDGRRWREQGGTVGDEGRDADMVTVAANGAAGDEGAA